MFGGRRSVSVSGGREMLPIPFAPWTKIPCWPSKTPRKGTAAPLTTGIRGCWAHAIARHALSAIRPRSELLPETAIGRVGTRSHDEAQYQGDIKNERYKLRT